LTNIRLAGRIPLDIRPVFYRDALCALEGVGIRPTAISSTLRRLVAKSANRSLQDAVVTKLPPTQLGFGVAHDAEAVVHATIRVLANMGSGKAVVKIDFKNAFNILRHEKMLNIVHSKLPMLYPFLQNCYACHSFLHFSHFMLMSDEGTRQGNPLGPLLFCSTMMTVVKRILFYLFIY
jgi:Reverse transcriptase (RNA-dependent DNA polymerase)